jgi:hypothetical protein
MAVVDCHVVRFKPISIRQSSLLPPKVSAVSRGFHNSFVVVFCVSEVLPYF